MGQLMNTGPIINATHASVLQCWCACGKLNVVADGTRLFVCECGRASEVDWMAEQREWRESA